VPRALAARGARQADRVPVRGGGRRRHHLDGRERRDRAHRRRARLPARGSDRAARALARAPRRGAGLARALRRGLDSTLAEGTEPPGSTRHMARAKAAKKKSAARQPAARKNTPKQAPGKEAPAQKAPGKKSPARKAPGKPG